MVPGREPEWGQTPRGLTPTEERQYLSDGFFVRHAQFSTTELAALRDAAESAVRRAEERAARGKAYFLDGNKFIDAGPCTLQYEHADGSREVRVIEPVHVFDERIDRLIDDPRLVAPMRALIDAPELALWTAKLNLKRAAGASGFGWHQDSPYWIHDSNHVDRLPNVMLALDAQSAENGCFRVIRGSHRQGILPGTDDGTQLGGFYTDPASFAAEHQVAMEVEAGSLIFFSPHSVHGSQPNRNGAPRRALIFTYQPGGHPQLKTGTVRNIAAAAP